MITNSFFRSSIGKKMIMALSGGLLFGFLIIHLLGNLILFEGRDAFNAYSFMLTKNKIFLYILEVGLALLFVGHIINGVRLTIKNKASRPTPYAINASLGKRSFASSNMGFTGSIIFIFLIVHLKTIKYGEPVYYNLSPYGRIRDFYNPTIDAFKNLWTIGGVSIYSIFYIVAIALLGFHLRHGVQSLAKSLGFYHTKYTVWVDRISLLFSLVLSLGFISIPVYFGFIH